MIQECECCGKNQKGTKLTLFEQSFYCEKCLEIKKNERRPTIEWNLIRTSSDLFANLIPFIENYEISYSRRDSMIQLRIEYDLGTTPQPIDYDSFSHLPHNRQLFIECCEFQRIMPQEELLMDLGFRGMRSVQPREFHFKMMIKWYMIKDFVLELSYIHDPIIQEQYDRLFNIINLNRYKIGHIGDKDIILL